MPTGGKRPGSGRKPQALAVYRLHMADWDAYHAVQLLAKWMQDEAQPIAVRIHCAEAVIKAVWGQQSVREIARQDAQEGA